MSRSVMSGLRAMEGHIAKALRVTREAHDLAEAQQSRLDQLQAERVAGTVHWLCKACGGDLTLADAQVQKEQLKYAELISHLKGIEWGEFEYDGRTYSKCPGCFGDEPDHEDDCWLWAALTEVR